MPERSDIQDAEPGEESLQLILGALTQETGTLHWPSAPEASDVEMQPEASGATLRWIESPEPALADATIELADAGPEPALADATDDEADAGPEPAAIGRVALASSETDPASETDSVPGVDGGPGASIEEAARRTGRSGVRPVQVIKRHRGTSVLAAGALVALAGGAVLGGWVNPVSVSLPSTHPILVDPSSHSESQDGVASQPAPPSTASSPSTTPPSTPSSSVANAPTGTPVTGPASSGSPGTSAGSDPTQSANSSSSTTPSAGTSSTGATSGASGTSGGTTAAPPSSGATPSGGGSTPTPPPATTPPTTPPGGGSGSGGLAGVLSGVLGSIFGSN